MRHDELEQRPAPRSCSRSRSPTPAADGDARDRAAPLGGTADSRSPRCRAPRPTAGFATRPRDRGRCTSPARSRSGASHHPLDVAMSPTFGRRDPDIADPFLPLSSRTASAGALSQLRRLCTCSEIEAWHAPSTARFFDLAAAHRRRGPHLVGGEERAVGCSFARPWPMTDCDEPYIGDESMTRPPASKNARMTSAHASRATRVVAHVERDPASEPDDGNLFAGFRNAARERNAARLRDSRARQDQAGRCSRQSSQSTPSRHPFVPSRHGGAAIRVRSSTKQTPQSGSDPNYRRGH